MLKKIYLLLGNRKLLTKSLALGAVLFFGNEAGLNAQYLYSDCGENNSCTNSANSGFFSTVASDLSYDNVISSFHSSAAYAQDGTIKVWGEASKPVNVGSNSAHVNWFGTPTTINTSNGFNIDGQPLKIALGSLYAKTGSNLGGAQYVLLTTTGKLYAWGFQGIVLPTGLTPTSGEAIQEVKSGGNPLGLPAGVNATDVKMLFGTAGTLALTTCGGEVYVLSQNDLIRQGGSATSWVKIQKAGGGDLTGIVATRGTSAGLFALDNQGNLWTWGYGTRLGTTGAGNILSSRTLATQMTLPGHSGSAIKMIAATKRFRNVSGTGMNRVEVGDDGGSNTSTSAFEFASNTISYFVLYEDGALYAMGENTAGQLGDFSTTNRDTWIQPRYTSISGPQMNDIKWISTQEHDGVIGFVSVINATKNLYNWGVESGSDMGRGTVGTTAYSARNPGMPTEWEDGNSNSNLLLVENGGHTTMVLQECKNTFGYVGHYRYGSMGDGRAGDTNSGDDIFRFTTSPLPLCGIETTPANLTVALGTSNNEYCNSSGNIQLVGAPAGGIYKILEVDAGSNFQGLKFTDGSNNSTGGILDLSTFNIPSNGSRTVRLGYVIPEGHSCAGNEVQLLITIKDCIVYNISISGKIWIDIDEDAIDDSPESILAGSGHYANLVDANGEVIQSVLVDPITGKYTITAGQNTLTSSGDYKIILTTTLRNPGTSLSTGATAPTGTKYTGTNRSDGVNPATSGNTSEQSGILIIGNLSAYANGAADVTLDDANFGVKGNMTISGNVWHDMNGDAETDGAEKPITGDDGDDNTEASSKTGSDIWANLVDASGEVVKSVQVKNDGTYEFEEVAPGSYKVILTTGEQQEGDPLSVGATIPGWVNTGTKDPVNNGGNANTGNKTNIIDLGPVNSNIANVDFGLQQPPVATNNSKPGITGNPVTIPTIINDDSDPEDESIDPTTVSLIVPDGATDVEEEDGRVKGFKVPGEGTWEVDENGNATFTPEEGFTDDPTPIKYTVEDEAGAKSNEATLTVTYGPAINISGKVWHDVDGDATDSGEVPVSGSNDDNGGTSSVTGGTVYANLVDNEGKVVASIQVDSDGTYAFSNVVSNVGYKVILTTAAQIPGEYLDDIDAAIPDNWEPTGTSLDGSPNTGNKTNVIDLGTVTVDVENANFGIQQPPVSDDSEYVIARPASDDIVPLDGTVAAITPAGWVNPPVGSDPDATNDAKASIVITKLPYVPDGQEADAEPVLYYDGDEVNETNFPGLVIEEFDPALFSVELKGKGYNQVSFDFKVVDAAGSESEESTYTLRWTGTLPVKWQNISVAEEQGHAVVSWRTVEELNVASYNVQYSTNARNWQTVGTLKAGAVSRFYSYTHKLSGNNLHYFRIQSVDLDGSTSLSKVVSLQGKAAASSVYPNPVVNGQLTLDVPVTSGRVKVYSLTGAEVLNTTLQGNVLNVRSLSAGQYVLQVTSESGETITRTFIVK